MAGKRAGWRPDGLPPSVTDLMFCLMAVFMTSTVLAMGSLMEGEQAREIKLPEVDLAEVGASMGIGAGEIEPMLLTLRQGPAGLEYFLGEEGVPVEMLETRIGRDHPTEVCLRVEAEVPFGEVIRVMERVREAGVPRVSFAVRGQEDVQ